MWHSVGHYFCTLFSIHVPSSFSATRVSIQQQQTNNNKPILPTNNYPVVNSINMASTNNNQGATDSPPLGKCHLKACKKQELAYPCMNFDKCAKHIHDQCCNNLMDYHSINQEKRPSQGKYVCGKRCLNTWLKAQEESNNPIDGPPKKKRIMWEKDGSLKLLLNWLTTEENYSKYCGGNNNDGTTKKAMHKSIAAMMSETTDGLIERSAKDIECKINKLESQFRNASDWLAGTGSGIDDPGKIEDYVKKLCPYYYDLEDVMGGRPNAQPLCQNESSSSEKEENEDTDEDNDNNDNAEDKSDNEEEPTTTPIQPARLNLDAVATSKKKPKQSEKGKGKNSSDDLILSLLSDNEFTSMREREVAAQETQANAVKAKSDQEIVLLKLQEKQAERDGIFDILQKRKQLEKDGYTSSEVDEFFPLPAK